MPKAPFANLIQCLRHLYPADDGGTASDGELLQRFISARDEDAFTALVHRHGSMVMGVCQRLLGDRHLAEDSFQATFIVLARRARSIRSRTSVGTWLYAVAQRVALKARAKSTAWRNRERQASTMTRREPLNEQTRHELRSIIDEEIARLPEKYQAPLVLCYLESKSHDRAARELDCAKSTLERRLARGRDLLGKQLIRRGVTLSAAALATALCGKSLAVPVGMGLVIKTTQAAVGVIAGKGLVAGCLTARGVVLAEEALRGIVGGSKLMGLVLAVGVVVGGASWVGYKTRAELPPVAVSRDAQRSADSVPRRVVAVDQYGDKLPEGAVARLGGQRFRHEGEAAGLLFTPDGKVLLGQTKFGVILWDNVTGKELRRLPVPFSYSGVNAMGVSPDGKTMAITEIVQDKKTTTGDNQKISLWDLQTGKKLRTLSYPIGATGLGIYTPSSRIYFTPDGKNLIFLAGISKKGRKAVMVEIASDRVRLLLGDEKSGFYDCTLAPDGKTLATVRYSKSGIQLWEVGSGKLLRELSAEPVRALAFSGDGKLLAVRGGNPDLIFDVATGKELYRLNLESGVIGWNDALMFTPDNKKLAYGSVGGVLVAEVATGKTLQNLSHFPWLPAYGGSMTLSPDGNTIAYGANHCKLQLWNLATGKALYPDHHGHEAAIRSVAFSPTGRTLVSADDDLQIFMWDRATNQRIGTIPSSARTVSFSGDGKQLAMIATNPDQSANKVRFWDMGAAKETLVVTVPNTRAIRSATFSPTGRKLFTVDWSKDRSDPYRLRQWDAVSGKQDQEWVMPHRDDPSATYRPGTREGAFADPAITLSVTPDGRTVFAVHANKVISIYDMKSAGKRLMPVQIGEEMLSIAPSPDGRIVATAWVERRVLASYSALESNSRIRLFEALTGQEIVQMKGHEGSISKMVWSPDGRFLASGDRRSNAEALTENQSVRLWDSATGKELMCFKDFKADVTALSFAPDNKSLGAGLRDGSILIWDVSDAHRMLPPTPKLGKEQLESQWTKLAGAKSIEAHTAGWNLVEGSQQSIPFLRSLLKPILVADPSKILHMIADLNSDKFSVRQAAVKTLARIDLQASPFIMAALKGSPSLETRGRLKGILKTISDVPNSETLRTIRAIAVLERIGSPEAKAVLETLTRGAPGARETEEAGASLERLAAHNNQPR